MKDIFVLNTKIYYSDHAMVNLKDIRGNTAFIVSDPIMIELGYVDKAKEYLKESSIDSIVFSEVFPDPDIEKVARGIMAFRQSNADIIIAIGGGSAIDTAKVIMLGSRDIDKNKEKPQFIAVPSTSGTGSEVTNISVITQNGKKTVLVDEYMSPDVAILDSTCIQHLPKKIVIDTGMDVLVHSLESYVSQRSSDFTDALAEKSIKLIFENLEFLIGNMNDQISRNAVHNASCMAGMAFTNTGLGINHSIAHALGGEFHISHGRANAVLIEKVIEFNSGLRNSCNTTAATRYSELAKILGCNTYSTRQGVSALINKINELKRKLGVESSISQLSIKKNEYEKKIKLLAKNALEDRCTATNPTSVSEADLVGILSQIW